ncbi:hypothetical protein AB0L57_25640 [Nocardia sp. NPDC052254]|uniref:hypothetical protein n=1 Tax=Nocardia sp. NPDC052254 TaxID=3155681 RepID=UPI003416B0C3
MFDIRRTADCPQAPIARRIADLAAASAWARDICGRLGGPGSRRGDAESSRDGAGVPPGEGLRISLRAAALCDIAEQSLRDLHNTISALSDCVADAEAGGCTVDTDWTVTGERDGAAGEWTEIVAAAVSTVRTADQRSHETIRAAAAALLDMANTFEPNIGIGAVAWTESPLTEALGEPGCGS